MRGGSRVEVACVINPTGFRVVTAVIGLGRSVVVGRVVVLLKNVHISPSLSHNCILTLVRILTDSRPLAQIGF